MLDTIKLQKILKIINNTNSTGEEFKAATNSLTKEDLTSATFNHTSSAAKISLIQFLLINHKDEFINILLSKRRNKFDYSSLKDQGLAELMITNNKSYFKDSIKGSVFYQQILKHLIETGKFKEADDFWNAQSGGVIIDNISTFANNTNGNQILTWLINQHCIHLKHRNFYELVLNCTDQPRLELIFNALISRTPAIQATSLEPNLEIIYNLLNYTILYSDQNTVLINVITKYLPDIINKVRVLKHGVNTSIIHIILKNNDVALMKFVSKSYSDLRSVQFSEHKNFLHLSFAKGTTELNKWAIKEYADLATTINDKGQTIAHIAAESATILYDNRENAFSNLQLIKIANPQLLKITDKKENTAVDYIVKHLLTQLRPANKRNAKGINSSLPTIEEYLKALDDLDDNILFYQVAGTTLGNKVFSLLDDNDATSVLQAAPKSLAKFQASYTHFKARNVDQPSAEAITAIQKQAPQPASVISPLYIQQSLGIFKGLLSEIPKIICVLSQDRLSLSSQAKQFNVNNQNYENILQYFIGITHFSNNLPSLCLNHNTLQEPYSDITTSLNLLTKVVKNTERLRNALDNHHKIFGSLSSSNNTVIVSSSALVSIEDHQIQIIDQIYNKLLLNLQSLLAHSKVIVDTINVSVSPTLNSGSLSKKHSRDEASNQEMAILKKEITQLKNEIAQARVQAIRSNAEIAAYQEIINNLEERSAKKARFTEVESGAAASFTSKVSSASVNYTIDNQASSSQAYSSLYTDNPPCFSTAVPVAHNIGAAAAIIDPTAWYNNCTAGYYSSINSNYSAHHLQQQSPLAANTIQAVDPSWIDRISRCTTSGASSSFDTQLHSTNYWQQRENKKENKGNYIG
ncbi:hypothetical protein [Rickettsiales endosymbiont of Stachyamoeba lipophora]|uniref:hypothetical protein n=1 Tax=Rickettsiales endosymbiont of Stachyamoeba lipophora TaxID=2486578 RepID=UPI000F6455C4|nr:hypothetical protein [Rickettsiales endosymbiont of Stachyamoeba lipophora]AZL14981.1 hypothetical protein EF513_00145 [Rickettsiales endosymbiont of Stachyamoeba lipophora]